jgi:hypothetical protein
MTTHSLSINPTILSDSSPSSLPPLADVSLLVSLLFPFFPPFLLPLLLLPPHRRRRLRLHPLRRAASISAAPTSSSPQNSLGYCADRRCAWLVRARLPSVWWCVCRVWRRIRGLGLCFLRVGVVRKERIGVVEGWEKGKRSKRVTNRGYIVKAKRKVGDW